MSLGLNEGGEFVPFVRFNAKDGSWENKVMNDDGTSSTVELSQAEVVFVADFENIETGWIKYVKGEAPDMQMTKVGMPNPPKPEGDYKNGFRLLVWSDKNLGGVREWSAASMAANGAMNALYAEYEAGKAANPGKLPVVQFTGAEKVGKHGNRAPKFVIAQWTARPAEFGGDVGSASQPTAQAAPTPAPVASAPPPPPPVAQPAAAAAGGVEF